MRAFSSDELARMQATQESAMQDECQILSYAEAGKDKYGYPNAEWPAGLVSQCGFDPTASKEVMDKTEVAITDARLRLPLSLYGSIDNRDRVRITERFGKVLAEQTVYEIIGEPERGPSGLVLNLKLVTDGSQ